jgi:glutamine amidotransferase
LVNGGTPYLGICVGMQILFESSEESPESPGLSLIPGKVLKFRANKVPQIGWNHIEAEQPGWESGFVYFVNSYYPAPDESSAVLYRAQYGIPFCAAVQHKNITAFQFHPEKSGSFGVRLLEQWLNNVSSN